VVSRGRLSAPISKVQKVRRGALPRGPIGHELAHEHRHWIGVDDAFDLGLAICPIGGLKRPRRPTIRLASRGPTREIGHAREPLELDLAQRLQAVHRGIEEFAYVDSFNSARRSRRET
jgi:hypothetical protein